MSRQGQFLTVPCRCSRTQEYPSPNGRSPRNDTAEVDFQNSGRSRKRCPEMTEELWNALTALREKTCRYRSKMEGNEFEDPCSRFQENPSPQCGGMNVLRRANDLIDYVPESEFLRKMKQQCRLLNCNEPNIFSALDEVTDDMKCFDFDRPRAPEYGYTPQSLPLPYYSRGNENYPPEATGDLPCLCQQHQSQLTEDKKSEHVSRNKKRVKGGRRKRKPGSAGTYDSGDQFQPSLKKPYENSCPRCWRYASPARSPVNKPDQKFDPNFRRAHSCANFEGKSGEDFDDLQVHDQSTSPCYRSKSIPSGPSDEKSPNKSSNVPSGTSPPRTANDAVRFSQPRTSSPRGPDLQISPLKPVQETGARPPSPRGTANYTAGPPPKGAQDSSPGRYSAPPAQYYSPQKPRPDYSPSRAPQEYSPGQARPRSMQDCPQYSSPARPRPDSSPERRSWSPRPTQDAPHQSLQSRPRPGSSPPIPTRDALQISSPTGSDRQNLSGSIMQEYLPSRCPVHPEVLLQQFPIRQMQTPNQAPYGAQGPEHYATPPTRPLREETAYSPKASPRTSQRPHHHTCPKHSPKMGQSEPMQRPKPQSFIPGGSSTDVNRCYVSMDQQNAASRGMYAPVEKDQCFQLCSTLAQAEDDLDVTEYKTFNPKSTSSKEQGYADYSLSRAGAMSPVPEECSYSPSTDGSSGTEAHDSTSYEGAKVNGSKANSKRNSRSSKGSKGSVEFANVKALSKSPGGSSGNNLNKSSPSRSPGSSPSRKKSPPGSQKKGKRKSPSPKNGSCKHACGKYVKKASSPKASAENRICPPVTSSPKEYYCNSCSAQSGTKAESQKKRSDSPKRNTSTPSPSNQNKPCPPSSPKPGPSGVQRPPQGRPQSANLATQSSPASPRERPQTAGSSNQADSSRSKPATKVPDEIYDAGHRVIDCTCFPRVQYSDPDGPLMCCHCQWQKNDADNKNEPRDVLDCGTRSSKGFQGKKIPCPYRKYAYHNLENSNFSSINPMSPMANGQNRSSLEESSDLSHSRLLRELNECIQNQNQRPENSAARKYVVFYMTQSKEPKENNVEVLVEEMSQSCPDKTDERAKDITEKMRKILDNPTDSMALRFQKGVAESRTPRTSRVLYF